MPRIGSGLPSLNKGNDTGDIPNAIRVLPLPSARIAVKILEANNVKYTFGVPGGHLLKLARAQEPEWTRCLETVPNHPEPKVNETWTPSVNLCDLELCREIGYGN